MSNITFDKTPEQPRHEVFDYPPLKVTLRGINTQAISVIKYGENPRLDSKRLLDELTKIQCRPENKGDSYGAIQDLWIALSIPSKPLGGASIPQIGLLLPELLGTPPYSDQEKIILNAVIKRLRGFRGPGIYDKEIEPDAALDVVALRIAVTLLTKERSREMDNLVFSSLIGMACNLCEMRNLFAINPREAVIDRLIGFAYQEPRLGPGIATLESGWEDFQAAPTLLQNACKLSEVPKDYEKPASWSSFNLGAFFQTFHATLTPWFQIGKHRNRQRFVQEIENAVANLSQEPEWFDPLAYFRDGAAFSQGPILMRNPAVNLGRAYSLDSGVDSEMFTQILAMFVEVECERWKLFLPSDVLGELLKELDGNYTGQDSTTLCRDLTTYWFTDKGRGSLHQFLGSQKPLNGPAFAKLYDWHNWFSQAISKVAIESSTIPLVEIAPRMETSDLSQRILCLGYSLLDIAPKKISGDILRIPNVEVREARLHDDEILGYDTVLSSAVYTLIERAQLPNRSIIGIDPQKLYAATPWALERDAIRGQLFPEVSRATKGMILFYVNRDSNGDQQAITPDWEPSEEFV
jgi:hypothetical protein